MKPYLVIIDQLGGSGRLKAMVGAWNFIRDGEKNVQFRFKGSKVANHVSISLNSKDLYDVSFCKVHGDSVKKEKHYKGNYNDGLVELFEEHTGLYLSL